MDIPKPESATKVGATQAIVAIPIENSAAITKIPTKVECSIKRSNRNPSGEDME